MLVPVYQSEIATKQIRGRLVSLQQWAITIGIAVSFWINYSKSCSKKKQNDIFFISKKVQTYIFSAVVLLGGFHWLYKSFLHWYLLLVFYSFHFHHVG